MGCADFNDLKGAKSFAQRVEGIIDRHKREDGEKNVRMITVPPPPKQQQWLTIGGFRVVAGNVVKRVINPDFVQRRMKMGKRDRLSRVPGKT